MMKEEEEEKKVEVVESTFNNNTDQTSLSNNVEDLSTTNQESPINNQENNGNNSEETKEDEFLYLMGLTHQFQSEETKLCLWKSTDDGYRWEGYGSRRLSDGTLNRKSYFRCVNVRDQNTCQAKKVIQEHPDDSNVVMVSYKGSHCHPPVRSVSSLHPILQFLHRSGTSSGPTSLVTKKAVESKAKEDRPNHSLLPQASPLQSRELISALDHHLQSGDCGPILRFICDVVSSPTNSLFTRTITSNGASQKKQQSQQNRQNSLTNQKESSDTSMFHTNTILTQEAFSSLKQPLLNNPLTQRFDEQRSQSAPNPLNSQIKLLSGQKRLHQESFESENGSGENISKTSDTIDNLLSDNLFIRGLSNNSNKNLSSSSSSTTTNDSNSQFSQQRLSGSIQSDSNDIFSSTSRFSFSSTSGAGGRVGGSDTQKPRNLITNLNQVIRTNGMYDDNSLNRGLNTNENFQGLLGQANQLVGGRVNELSSGKRTIADLNQLNVLRQQHQEQKDSSQQENDLSNTRNPFDFLMEAAVAKKKLKVSESQSQAIFQEKDQVKVEEAEIREITTPLVHEMQESCEDVQQNQKETEEQKQDQQKQIQEQQQQIFYQENSQMLTFQNTLSPEIQSSTQQNFVPAINDLPLLS